MNTQRSAVGSPDVVTQAIDWMLTLQGRNVDAAQIAAWQHWLAESPEHKRAFDRLQSVQECIEAVRPVPWPTASEMEADSGNRRPRRHWFIAGAAAGIAAAFVGAFAFHALHRDGRVATAVGELRRVQLEDGSSVTLGGRTSVTVDYGSAIRQLTLDRGEAFFEVAKDAQRPFVVRSGSNSVKAIGTAFNVRRSGNGITVAVAEGVVEIASPAPVRPKAPQDEASVAHVTRLEAGQRVRIEPKHPALPSPVAPETVAAWREGERQYLAEPLSDVVADLARYSTRRIVIEDPAIGRLQVTGAVFEREMDRWLTSLQSAFPVEVTQERGGVVHIRARKSQ